MTPEERAEKIWNSYMTREQFIATCAAEIREAVEEANMNLTPKPGHLMPWEAQKIKAEAYEDAAKIAFDGHEKLDIGHQLTECQRCSVARDIRARAKELK